MENGLWGECPPERKFDGTTDRVVIAELKGPAVITMIHFALPAAGKLDRSTLLRIYWDGEASPSVEAPLVDFFADPDGALERVDSALVNKKRGWNCYFPMPFARSARVELVSQDPRYPGNASKNPCYSYVMAQKMDALPAGAQYFHAHWRQQALLLGKEEYRVFEADGPGQFVGWNMTVRGVGAPGAGYPVDENVNFHLDGETTPSIVWMGLEDGFGFSWGFPGEANGFPYTGFQPWHKGAAAYRFCVADRITFCKQMRMTVGFGPNETWFHQIYSQPKSELELSSVAYWYQAEPHTPWEAMPAADIRRPTNLPAPAATEAARRRAQEHVKAGEALALDCGSPAGDVAYLKDGWDFTLRGGYSYARFPGEVKHCWADAKELKIELRCPKGAGGLLRLYLLDADNFMGGRKESVRVAGREIATCEHFQQGRWIEVPIAAADTAEGRLPIAIRNLNPAANAVVSYIRFVEGGPPQSAE
ncbi:MAG: DUF2961 domain-containing protein [bacterium]|nr:DUF2961 domain-containing protein [bacterium]